MDGVEKCGAAGFVIKDIDKKQHSIKVTPSRLQYS
jgi:hypothetical protein